MKRSEINNAYRKAGACFAQHQWALPPNPKWDITDFGLGDFARFGLTLINLAAEPEYCEKLMYAWQDQTTPCHTHARKKEDIICRAGSLRLQLWSSRPDPVTMKSAEAEVTAPVNGEPRTFPAGALIILRAGERVTLVPGVWHAFAPASAECIIGEVSTANDDLNDNYFLDPQVGRFPGIEEDEPAAIRLLSDLP